MAGADTRYHRRPPAWICGTRHTAGSTPRRQARHFLL